MSACSSRFGLITAVTGCVAVDFPVTMDKTKNDMIRAAGIPAGSASLVKNLCDGNRTRWWQGWKLDENRQKAIADNFKAIGQEVDRVWPHSNEDREELMKLCLEKRDVWENTEERRNEYICVIALRTLFQNKARVSPSPPKSLNGVI